jgi:hypothetical protein
VVRKESPESMLRVIHCAGTIKISSASNRRIFNILLAYRDIGNSFIFIPPGVEGGGSDEKAFGIQAIVGAI